MKQDKPIVFFDIESTGLDTAKDRIIEMSMIKLTTVDGETQRDAKTKRFNPQIPISPQATEVHGISNDDVKDLEPFRRFAKGIAEFITGCDIAGFNSNRFDIPMLATEFARAGVSWDWKESNFIDVGNMYKIENPRTLVAAYKQYTGKDLDDAHSAEADVEATISVFKSICEEGLKELEGEPTPEALALYSNFGKKMVDLHGNFVLDDDGDIVFNFSKHAGKKVKTEIGFIRWMLTKDFPTGTIEVCQKILNG